jgi:hypothetical protein
VVIRRRFPGTAVAEIELLLADVRRDAEEVLFDLLHDTITLGAVIDVVAQRFFEED